MLHNSDYNKVKILHDLCALHWFVEKHAVADAQAAQDNELVALLQDLSKMLDTYEQTLQRLAKQ